MKGKGEEGKGFLLLPVQASETIFTPCKVSSAVYTSIDQVLMIFVSHEYPCTYRDEHPDRVPREEEAEDEQRDTPASGRIDHAPSGHAPIKAIATSLTIDAGVSDPMEVHHGWAWPMSLTDRPVHVPRPTVGHP